jgi:hypothetical protein
MVIGYLSSGTFYLNGAIDDVKIYNRALSGNEVSQLYKSDKSKTSTSPTKSINSGLISYYTMDGKDMNYSSLTATDRGSNKLTGTLVSVNTDSSVVGKIGGALRTGATASAQYVSISEAADDSITTQWSASVWVYRNSASDGTIIRNDEGNGTRGFLIDIFSNNARSYAYVNGVNVATGATTLSAGKWYHLVGVCDGTTVKIYLNSVQDGSANIGTGGNIGLSSTPLYIGYGNFANSNFDGYIDDVRIYNRALSLGEIKTLYKLGQNKDAVSPTKSLTSNLVGYWTLDGNKTNWVTGTTQDSSVNGNSGILRRLSTTTSPVPGKIGQALKFNDANTYVDLGTPSALNSLQVPMTITGWFKQLSSSPSLQTIFGQYNNTSGHKLLKLIRLDSGVLKYYGSTAAGSFQSFGTFTPSINTWHFFAVTVSGSVSPVVKIYLDSSSESTTFAALSSTPDTTVATYIGANESAPNNEMFSGIIDDIRVYNRALSDSEINQLKSLGVSIRR